MGVWRREGAANKQGETQGRACAAAYLAVALLSFALCVYSFVGSEYLGVATRGAPDSA